MEEFPEFGSAVGEELGMLADHEAPPSTVSAAVAVRQGRARIRRRRTAVLGAVAAMLVTAGALTSLRPDGLVRIDSPAGPGVPSAHLTPSPLSSLSPPAIHPIPQGSFSQTSAPFTGSDPLQPELQFGWLPDGIATLGYRVDFLGTSTRASGASTGAGTEMFFILAAYPKGAVPGDFEVAGGIHVTPVPAPAVNGREAYWLVDDKLHPAGGRMLRWKMADGRWAELGAANLAPGDVEQVALRIAAAVTPATHPVPLPFKLSLPSGYKVSETEFDRATDAGHPGWTAHLSVSSPDGHSAIPTDIASGSASTPSNEVCRSDRGVRACVPRYDSGPDPLTAVGGPDAWLARVTLLGADESNWTTDVIG